jgi:hypothetical protein
MTEKIDDLLARRYCYPPGRRRAETINPRYGALMHQIRIGNFGPFLVTGKPLDGEEYVITWADEEGKARSIAHDIAMSPAAKSGVDYSYREATAYHDCMGASGLRFFCCNCDARVDPRYCEACRHLDPTPKRSKRP